MGVVAAWKHGTWIDRAVMVLRGAGFLGAGFRGRLFAGLCVRAATRWLPVQGYTPIAEGCGRSCATWCCRRWRWALTYMALIARITRATMLDVLNQDYVRTAKAKGVGQRRCCSCTR